MRPQLVRILEQVTELPPESRPAQLDELCAHDPRLRSEIEALLRVHDHGTTVDPAGTGDGTGAGSRAGAVTATGSGPVAENRSGSEAGDATGTESAASRANPSLLSDSGPGTRATNRPKLPNQIGRYPILDLVRVGSMGIVYRARDPLLEREVALRVLPASFAANPTRLALFRREAKLLATVDHHAIATIYTIEELPSGHAVADAAAQADASAHTDAATSADVSARSDALTHSDVAKQDVAERVDAPTHSNDPTHPGGAFFLTMELVTGETLQDRLARSPIPVEEALRLCRQVATALEVAHAKGVVHRDLNPRNVKVTPHGRVKVLDFGFTPPVDSLRDSTVNLGDSAENPAPTEVLSTPGYMSPEQLLGQPCDHRADIWAFGCLLHACLTGRSPFAGPTVLDVIRASLQDPDLTKLDELGSRLRPLIQDCLQLSPEDRPSAMSDVRRALDDLIAGGHDTREPAAPEPVSAPNNLRRRLTDVIGRDDELNALREDLQSYRLITLTGAGGCGKTRLALEVAWDQQAVFPHGVWVIELAAIEDPEQVPAAVLNTMGLREQPGSTPKDVLIAHARERRLLLILDNCEHLLDTVREFTRGLLESCPSVHVLASSREELGVSGEHVVPISPLPVPDVKDAESHERMTQNPAVRLFLERARTMEPNLEVTDEDRASVVEICRRLDGLPLALELAAARARVLSMRELADRLDRRLDMLKGGPRSALPRHKTLRGLIEWSYELLEDSEQRVFRRLAVFIGGWNLESAEAVCEDETIESWDVLDLLARLVEKSLIVPDGRRTGESTRFHMLETVRQYAQERLLQSEDTDRVRERHRDYFLSLAEQAAQHLTGNEHLEWLARLTPDHENLRRAMDTCVDLQHVGHGMRFAVALADYWMVRCHWEDGEKLAARALDQSDPSEPSSVRGRILAWLGVLAEKRGDYEVGRSRSQEALIIFRALKEPQGEARAINNLAILAADQGDYAQARMHYEESLALSRQVGDDALTSRLLNNLGTVAKSQGDHDAARGYLEEGLEMCRAMGRKLGVANALANLALIAKELGDLETSRSQAEEALPVYRELGNQAGVAYIFGLLADIEMQRKDYPAARRYYEESLDLRERIGDRHGVGQSLSGLGTVFQSEGDLTAARDYLLRGLAVFEEIGHVFGVAQAIWVLGCIAAQEGQSRRAIRLLATGEQFFENIGCIMPPDTVSMTERARAAAAEKLSEEEVAAETERGKRSSVPEAIVYARGAGD